MKTIATLLILFCSVTFSNAQEKKLPNKEETKEYLLKMIMDGSGKEYVSNDNTVARHSLKYGEYRSAFEPIGSFAYNWGTTSVSCNDRVYGYAKTTDSDVTLIYSGYDFKKLSSVKQNSKSVLNATALEIRLDFDANTIERTFTYRTTAREGCYRKDDTSKTDVVWFYIPNEEGSFDRFKKALFHYKDLLIAEQKQKIADDPFAN